LKGFAFSSAFTTLVRLAQVIRKSTIARSVIRMRFWPAELNYNLSTSRLGSNVTVIVHFVCDGGALAKKL
jgi:hypothetical protein